MSITDELREWAMKKCLHMLDADGYYELLAIADRIDERYHRDMATAQQVGINEGEDAAMRDGWVELPKDADGVPIHVGDELCGYGRPNGGVFCKAVNEHMVLVGEKDDGYKMWLLWDGSECRHYHEPTVEDVLREFFSRYVTTKPKDEDDAILAEYAAKLRLAKEGRMSITDELRDCIRTANRSYEDVRNPYNDREILYIPEEELTAIADRIDEAHKHAIGYVADYDPETMAENGWVKLPVDADGVPIHVGDEVKLEHSGRVTTVTNINYNEYGWQVYCAEGGGFDKDTRCRHVQPDTWERIIGDAANLVRGDNESVVELVERCRRLAGEA